MHPAPRSQPLPCSTRLTSEPLVESRAGSSWRLDLHDAGAIAERLCGHAHRLQQGELEIRQRRLRCHLNVPPAFELAACTTGNDDRQRLVIMLVAVAHAAAIHRD